MPNTSFFTTVLCPSSELHLEATLRSGQSFRWVSLPTSSSSSIWRGVIDDVCYDLIEANLNIYVRQSKNKSPPTADQMMRLKDYFFLEHSLTHLVDIVWSGKSGVLATTKDSSNPKKVPQNKTHPLVELFQKTVAASREETLLKRVRLLKQDPIEMIFSFLCSQNNHLKRITSMINTLSAKCGEKVFDGDEYDANFTRNDDEDENINNNSTRGYYKFPSCKSIAKVPEEFWREKGFGYRAKYIYQTACQIAKEGQDQFVNRVLSAPTLNDARNVLLELCGIGRKVADCILLSGFMKFDVAPMDTHMIAIIKQACPKEIEAVVVRKTRDIERKKNNNRSTVKKQDDDKVVEKKVAFSPAQHDEAQRLFREAFGELSGWAQLVFFVSRVGGGSFSSSASVSGENVAKESGKRRQRE